MHMKLKKNPKVLWKRERIQYSCRPVQLMLTVLNGKLCTLLSLWVLLTARHSWAHIRYKIFLVLTDIQERPFSITHSIDFTFRLQRYTYRYCSKNHRNLKDPIFLCIEEYNLQCQLSLHPIVVLGVPNIWRISSKNCWQQLREAHPLWVQTTEK